MREEHADRGAGRLFPVEWGAPVGRPGSEERAAWVLECTKRHSATTAHRKLANANGRLQAIARAAELDSRK